MAQAMSGQSCQIFASEFQPPGHPVLGIPRTHSFGCCVGWVGSVLSWSCPTGPFGISDVHFLPDTNGQIRRALDFFFFSVASPPHWKVEKFVNDFIMFPSHPLLSSCGAGYKTKSHIRVNHALSY